MEDLEEDPEMRSKVNLYRKDQKSASTKPKKVKGKSEKEKKGKEKTPSTTSMESEEDHDDTDGLPQVPNEELIDELAEAMGTMTTGKTEISDVKPDDGDDDPITFD